MIKNEFLDMLKGKGLTLVLTILGIFLFSQSIAASYTWVGSTVPKKNKWHNESNWLPEGVPGCDDIAIFNSSATVQDCYADKNIRVGSITLEVTYTGTLKVGERYIQGDVLYYTEVALVVGPLGILINGGTLDMEGKGQLTCFGLVEESGGVLIADDLKESMNAGNQFENFCHARIFHELSDKPSLLNVAVANDELNFIFVERYQDGYLNFKIYDKLRSVVSSSQTVSVPKKYGENEVVLDLSALSLTSGEYYYLEVYDENERKKYLKFQY